MSFDDIANLSFLRYDDPELYDSKEQPNKSTNELMNHKTYFSKKNIKTLFNRMQKKKIQMQKQ